MWIQHNFGFVAGLDKNYYSMWTLTKITQSSIYQRHRGIIFLNTAPIQQAGKHVDRMWGGCINIIAMLVLNILGVHETLFYFGLVAWLNAAMPQ